ncbi:MAG TPA: PA2779 family protein, partial [Thermoanaerobaculia bacterium]|nr:PA2779 family protein [Thermoanaerobaculia bacterium]
TRERPLGAGIKEKEVVVKKSLIVVVLIALVAMPTFAAPVPSKTAANQSIESREADLAVVRDIASNEQVAQVLASHGFTQAQVNQRLAQMSPQDVHQLAQNLGQLQPAGLTKQEWIWVGIGALAALILVVALSD